EWSHSSERRDACATHRAKIVYPIPEHHTRLVQRVPLSLKECQLFLRFGLGLKHVWKAFLQALHGLLAVVPQFLYRPRLSARFQPHSIRNDFNCLLVPSFLALAKPQVLGELGSTDILQDSDSLVLQLAP